MGQGPSLLHPGTIRLTWSCNRQSGSPHSGLPGGQNLPDTSGLSLCLLRGENHLWGEAASRSCSPTSACSGLLRGARAGQPFSYLMWRKCAGSEEAPPTPSSSSRSGLRHRQWAASIQSFSCGDTRFSRVGAGNARINLLFHE